MKACQHCQGTGVEPKGGIRIPAGFLVKCPRTFCGWRTFVLGDDEKVAKKAAENHERRHGKPKAAK